MSGVEPGAAFYCVSDSRYFLGAVAMINSLRLQGHDEPVYLLDAGLTESQRRLLGPHVTVVAPAGDRGPHLQKTIAPLRHRHEVMALIDSDMIVTRPLGELLETAAAGPVVAFCNNVDHFMPEWGELLGLGPLERRPYLCSGFVAMPADPGVEILELMEDRQRRVDYSRTLWVGNDVDYPLLYADQDVFNAVLASRPADRLVSLDYRLAAPTPFGGLEVSDEIRLRCAYPDGEEPFLIHHLLQSKPWLDPMFHGVFSQLLMRALVGPGLELRVPDQQIPLRLRNGALGRLERRRIHIRDRLGWFARDHLPRSLFERLDQRRVAASRR
jgi:hypothetical protein